MKLREIVLAVAAILVSALGAFGQSSGVISTRPICYPNRAGLEPCSNRYVQGPSGTLLPNGDLVILVNAGVGNGDCSSTEAIMALAYPNDPAASPRWYPIYAAANWAPSGTCATGEEHEAAFPTSAYFNNAWHIAYIQTHYYPGANGTNAARTARIDAPSLISQPSSRTAEWIKPNPPCDPLYSCLGQGDGTGFDEFVQALDGSVYEYHADGLHQNCPKDATHSGTLRELVTQSGSYPYQHAGCLAFPAGGNNFTPSAIYDLARGADGLYYLLGSDYPFEFHFSEWSSMDGLNFTYTSKNWDKPCSAINADPGAVETDCAVRPSSTSCFITDGNYVRDQSGIIVTPRIVMGLVGTYRLAIPPEPPGIYPVNDGNWHLHYWADAGAALPATWFDTPNHVAYAPSCPAPALGSAGTPSYQGSFDGLDFSSASGWAWNWYQPTTPINVDVFDNGVYFSTVPASALRTDLQNPTDPSHFYYGDGRHGWSLAVPNLWKNGLTQTIDTRFAGTTTSLPNSSRTLNVPVPSSLALNPTSVVGGTSVSGTVTLTATPPAGGISVAVASTDTAAQPPSPVTVTSISQVFTIPTTAVARVTSLTIQASNGSIVRNAVLTVNPATNIQYGGHFDVIDCNALVGWVWNPSFPNTPIAVDIFDGTTLLAAGVVANSYRPDLGGYGNQFHGFALSLPASLKNSSSHSVHVKFSGTSLELPGGPMSVTCGLKETALIVDANSTGAGDNANGVFEPGETIELAPNWQNKTSASLSVTGVASAFSGPDPQTLYTIGDSAANYGPIAAGSTASCHGVAPNCYQLTLGAPGARPSVHWDGWVTETTNTSGGKKLWILHVGKSFSDVQTSHIFYKSIETVLHTGITAGCGSGTTYCPDAAVTRDQMAVFLVKAKRGASYIPPPPIGVFTDVAPAAFAASYIEQIYRDGITAGCGGGNYCPASATTRAQMAVFLLKSKNGSSFAPPPATGSVFTDVHVGDFAADWIEELSHEGGVASGVCGSGKYCPGDSTTRGQMAGFMTNTFDLTLYGP